MERVNEMLKENTDFLLELVGWTLRIYLSMSKPYGVNCITVANCLFLGGY